MQKSHNQDKPIPLISFKLQRIFRVVQFSDKLKPLRNGPFEAFKKPRQVTYELLTQDGKAFHTQRNQLTPYYPKEPLLFSHIYSYNEQNLEIFHDSDT